MKSSGSVRRRAHYEPFVPLFCTSRSETVYFYRRGADLFSAGNCNSPAPAPLRRRSLLFLPLFLFYLHFLPFPFLKFQHFSPFYHSIILTPPSFPRLFSAPTPPFFQRPDLLMLGRNAVGPWCIAAAQGELNWWLCNPASLIIISGLCLAADEQEVNIDMRIGVSPSRC